MRSLLCFAVLAIVPLGLSCTEDTPPPAPPPEPDCGNGMLEEGEVCEGMPTPTGCNPNTCQVQVGWACSPEPPITQGETDGFFEPIEWTSTCEELDTCGDGVVDPGEDCDDNDTTVGDGCSNCTVDPLWTCLNEPGEASQCWQCGDGFLDIDFGEECDDGHENDNVGMDTPGCSIACMIEPGWECFQLVDQTSACQPLCGDGIWFDSSVPGVNLASAEGCDDGNLIDGDGCSSSCDVEMDCECSGPVEGMSTCMCGLGDSTDSGGSTDSGSSSGDPGTSSGTGGSSTG